MNRWCIALGLVGALAGTSMAQESQADSTARCDSIVSAARVDTVSVGLFFTANRIDGFDFLPGQAKVIATAVATWFSPPAPLKVSVFDGPAQMPSLRRHRVEAETVLRAPSITGVYRFTSTKTAAVAHVEVVRATLAPDLDRAMIAAIHDASVVKEVVELPDDQDSMRVQVRISSDSGPGSQRATTVRFLRMPVVDAVPARDNPPPIVPEPARDLSEEVLLRFVVGPTGIPEMATVELARGRSPYLIRAALEALPVQLFSPATVAGCAVSQVVYFPFSFGAATEKSPPRH